MNDNAPPEDAFAGWRDYRVLMQRFNPAADGPQYIFVTVHAPDADAAGIAGLSSLHKDANVSLVQVVEANEFVTGFDEIEIRSAMTQDEREIYELRTHFEKEFQRARLILHELRAADAAAAEGSPDA